MLKMIVNLYKKKRGKIDKNVVRIIEQKFCNNLYQQFLSDATIDNLSCKRILTKTI